MVLALVVVIVVVVVVVVVVLDLMCLLFFLLWFLFLLFSGLCVWGPPRVVDPGASHESAARDCWSVRAKPPHSGA